MSDETKGATPRPWTTNGFNIFGPADGRSKHSNGLPLIGGVVDDANDWRGRPIGEPISRAEFREERIANAALIVRAVNLHDELVSALWGFSGERHGRAAHFCAGCDVEPQEFLEDEAHDDDCRAARAALKKAETP